MPSLSQPDTREGQMFREDNNELHPAPTEFDIESLDAEIGVCVPRISIIICIYLQ